MSDTAATAKPLGRAAFLAETGKLARENVQVDGLGTVLCQELTGSARARVLQVLAPAAAGGVPDFERYQEMLLELGTLDPDDEKPLLDMATVKEAMKLGGSKIEKLCSAIERLSGLDAGANKRAEGNSASTQSSTSTSE